MLQIILEDIKNNLTYKKTELKWDNTEYLFFYKEEYLLWYALYYENDVNNHTLLNFSTINWLDKKTSHIVIVSKIQKEYKKTIKDIWLVRWLWTLLFNFLLDLVIKKDTNDNITLKPLWEENKVFFEKCIDKYKEQNKEKTKDINFLIKME